MKTPHQAHHPASSRRQAAGTVRSLEPTDRLGSPGPRTEGGASGCGRGPALPHSHWASGSQAPHWPAGPGASGARSQPGSGQVGLPVLLLSHRPGDHNPRRPDPAGRAARGPPLPEQGPPRPWSCAVPLGPQWSHPPGLPSASGLARPWGPAARGERTRQGQGRPAGGGARVTAELSSARSAAAPQLALCGHRAHARHGCGLDAPPAALRAARPLPAGRTLPSCGWRGWVHAPRLH